MPVRLPAPVRLVCARLLPVLLALAAIVLVEATTAVEPVAVQARSEPVPETRLVIFWIDSLAVRDVEEGDAMPRLRARLPGALHGPVRECMDAVSVPCIQAAVSGSDRFSLFSLARNLGGAARFDPGGLFGALRARGVRLGFIGDSFVAPVFAGFDWFEVPPEDDDAAALERGLAALESQRLGLLVVHLREVDQVSHRVGPRSVAYRDTLDRADRLVDAALGRLRPTDHAVVFGDHGHTLDGRHNAGLDVPTYTALFGPRFARPLRQPMALTEAGSLWAAVFGLKLGDLPWFEDYLAGAPVSPRAGLPEPPRAVGAMPLWGGLVGLLLAALAWGPRASGDAWALTGLRRTPLVIAAVVFAFGTLYATLRTSLHGHGFAGNVALGLGFALFGAVLILAARRDLVRSVETLATALLAGAVALAVPTVYKYGGVFTALTGLLVLTFAGLVLALEARAWRRAALGALLLLLLWTIWDPAVRDFGVRWFPMFTERLASLSSPVCGLLAGLALGLGAGPRWRAWGLAGLAGSGFAAAGPWLPPAAFLAPCLMLFPLLLLAHRRMSAGPLVAFAAPPALWFFFGGDPARLAPVLAALAAFPVAVRARPAGSSLGRGLVLLVLVWACFWTTCGGRVAGLDFAYFFRWLPEGEAVEATWAANALLTTSLYLSVPLLGLLLATRASAPEDPPPLGSLWSLARLKLGLVLLFVVGFALAPGGGPFLAADVVTEAALWALLVLGLAPLPLASGPGERQAEGHPTGRGDRGRAGPPLAERPDEQQRPGPAEDDGRGEAGHAEGVARVDV